MNGVLWVRSIFLLASVTCCFALAPTPVAAAEADDAVAKYKAFLGWSFGDGTLRSLVLEGHRETKAGKRLSTFTYRSRGAIMRDTYISVSTGSHIDTGFDGTRFWNTDENGFALPSLGDAAKFRVSDVVLFAGGLPELKPELVSHTTLSGVPVTVVRFEPSHGFPIEASFDTATGELKRAIIAPGGAYEARYDFVAYSEVLPGKRYPSRWISDDVIRVVDTMKPNVELGAADLSPPKATASWTFGTPVLTPLELTKNRIIITAKINGVQGRFIFDTGAQVLAVTDGFARRAGLERIGTQSSFGVGGISHNALFRAKTFEIAGSTLSNVLVSTSGGFTGNEDENTDGLVGSTLLDGALVAVDLNQQGIEVFDPVANEPDRSSGMVVNVDLSNGSATVPMQLDGRADVRALLDSGSPLEVLLSDDLVTHQHILFHTSFEAMIGGVGGTERAECGNVDSLNLGPVRYLRPPACMIGSWGGRGTLSGTDIIVGLDFMRHFNYVFDYPEGVIIFIPHNK